MSTHVAGTCDAHGIARHMLFARDPQRDFLACSAVLFVVSATITIVGCASMSSMDGMSMPGNWTLSMAWMRMPGQTWPGVAAAFLGMWIVMMVAMMLPSLLPMLLRYRRTIGAGDTRRGWLTALVGLGYFFVWSVSGIAVFAFGAALATAQMHWSSLARAVPLVVGLVVMIGGALQFSAWKAHHLARCRGQSACIRRVSADARSAFRHGLRLGLHCSYCCAGLTATLLAIGVMDLRAMAALTAAISAERLAPGGERVARFTGATLMGAAMLLIARALL